MSAESRTFVSPREGISVANLTKYEMPRTGYQESVTMRDVLHLVEEKRNKVVHIHGMPGSGKSQIIAAVCKIMSDKGYIVWHVQCQQGINKLNDGWSKFVERLCQEGIVTEADKVEILNALNNFEGQSMKKFIDKCNGIDCPVIFAVELEDTDDDESRRVMADDKALLRSFIDEIRPRFNDILNVQLLVASRNQDILYLRTDLAAMDFYKTEVIEGFTKEESKQFLLTSEMEHTSSKLLELAEELAYSPLGLLLAKSYCQEYQVSYDQYYDSLGKDDLIITKEKELLLRHPDLGKYHRYEVIMKLLSPKETDGKDRHLEFKVMKMVSFLNKNNIPSQVFENFFRMVKPMDSRSSKIATVHLMGYLEIYVGAIREKTSDESSGNVSMSLHGDILRVLNASMPEDEKQEMLTDAVIALSSMPDKDRRMEEEFLLLDKIEDHLVQLALHCSKHLRPLGSDHGNASITAKDYEAMLGLSRINELIGFAISRHPGSLQGNKQDSYYQKALEFLWAVIISENDNSSRPMLLKKRSEHRAKRLERLVSYEEKKDPRKTAEEVFKKTKDVIKSDRKLREALLNDYRRNFPVKIRHIVNMKRKVGENSEIDWNLVTNQLHEEGRISATCLALLAKNGAMIEWEKLNKIYVVERMASILYSRAHQDKQYADLLTPEMLKKCQWWIDFGFHLCDVAKEKTGVKSTFHFLLRANNKLRIMTRNRRGENDQEFLNRLTDARKTALSLGNESDDFYEHGIFKSICGSKWTRMNAMRYLVKVNTKARKRPAVLPSCSMVQADVEAEDLYKLAKVKPNDSIAGSCLVHVAKYYAAKNEYKKAINTFELAFVNWIDEQAVSNPARYAWALYNMQRAVSTRAGREFCDRRLLRKIEKRFELTETNGTPDEWKVKLKSIRLASPVPN